MPPAPPDKSVRNSAPLSAARAYRRAGLSFMPIALDGSKAPDGRLLPPVPDDATGGYRRSWDPLTERRPTEAEVREWFDRADPPGIGIIGGKVSGNLEQLDFDREAETIFPAWSALVEEEQPGLVARLSVARTP